MQVTIKELYISPGHNYFGRYGKGSLDHAIVPQESLSLVAGKGIEGDRFFDFKPDYKGQITFFDQSVHQAVCEFADMPEVPSSSYRRNVIIEGVDLNSLIGKRFAINGVEMTGSGECSPCFWMDEAVREGAEEFLKGRGGLRARILIDGVLNLGPAELTMIGDLADA
ncbi:MOSC domain-containing protein [Rubritalea marina]|uniref:MOSC domain-containing protein n=1 Tax=Rubritalea marina TaxID=361055 RepID=UPI000373AA87|nr:hypothetical protein [Rubritalea marina]